MNVLATVCAVWDRVARRWNRRQEGAALVEYALLVAFIAVVCIAAVAYVGGWIDDSLTSTGDRL